LIINKIRSDKGDIGLFEEFMDDPEICEILLRKGMNDYHRWHREILNKEAFSTDISIAHNKYVLPDLNLIVLNTCLTSCDDNDQHNLYIIEGSLLPVFEGLDHSNPTFVIGHHGIDYFKESEQKKLEHLFDTKNVDVYLCGHSHEFGCWQVKNTARTIHQITCGSNATDKHSKMSFIYGHYDNKNHCITLKLYSYEENGNRNWQHNISLNRKVKKTLTLKLTGTRKVPLLIKAPVNREFNVASSMDSVQKKSFEETSGFFRHNDKSEVGKYE